MALEIVPEEFYEINRKVVRLTVEAFTEALDQGVDEATAHAIAGNAQRGWFDVLMGRYYNQANAIIEATARSVEQ